MFPALVFGEFNLAPIGLIKIYAKFREYAWGLRFRRNSLS